MKFSKTGSISLVKRLIQMSLDGDTPEKKRNNLMFARKGEDPDLIDIYCQAMGLPPGSDIKIRNKIINENK